MAGFRFPPRLRFRPDAGLAAVAGGLAVLIGGVVGVMQDQPGWAVALSTVGAAVVGWAIYLQVRSSPSAVPVAAAPAVGPGSGAVWNIPPPVAGFTGRQDDLAALEAELSAPGLVRMVAVNGLGGMGKTQVALRHAAIRAERADVGVGWLLNASSRAYLLDGLARLGLALGVPDAGSAESFGARVVAELGRHRDWLLVYDDAKDQATVGGLLPVSGPGKIVITSRHADWRGAVTTLRIEPMDDESSADFLQARTGDGDRPAALALAQRLGGLPLALEQAAAYCQDGVGFRKYLDLFARAPIALLDVGHPHDHEPVARTWRMGLAAARGRDRAAIELLAFLAFVAPVALPRDVFSGFPGALPRRLRRVAEDQLAFDRAVRVLVDFSLVVVQPDGFYAHALLQEVMRARIGRRIAFGRSRAGWIGTVIRTLVEQFPREERVVDQWERCAVLRPHAEAVLALAEQPDRPPTAAAELGHRLAHYVRDRGEYAAARELLDRAVTTAVRRSSPNADVILDCLGITLYELGDFDGARAIFEQLLGGVITIEDDEVSLPLPDDVDELYRLAVMNNLANALNEQGELNLAREINLHVFAKRHRLLGRDDLLTLASMNNLGWVLGRQGDLEIARDLHEYVLENRRRLLGDDHPDTLDTIDSLAPELRALGDLDRARTLHEEEVASRRKVQGDDHPRTLIAIRNLAELRDQPAAVVPAPREAPAGSEPGRLAPTAAVYLAQALFERDHLRAAASILWRVVDDGHSEWAPMAAVILGNMIASRGALIGVPRDRSRRYFRRSPRPDEEFIWAPAIEVDVGLKLEPWGDRVAARTPWRRAIDSRHPEYAPMAAINLGYTHYGIGDPAELGRVVVPLHHPGRPVERFGVVVMAEREVDEARAAWQLAVDSGHAEYAPEGAYLLGRMYAAEGDLPSARSAYQVAVDSGHPVYAERATAELRK